MFRRKLAILLLVWFSLLFIKQGVAAEIDSSQRDGPFVMIGQVSGGLFGQSIGLLVVGVSLLYFESLIFGETYLSEIHLFASPGFVYGGMVGAMFGSAGTVHLIGETVGSGGGSFKETLKWSPLTPIGATIGYQRSKGRFVETDSSQRDGPFVMAGQVGGGLLALGTGAFWGLGIGGAVSSTFLEDRETFGPAEFYGAVIGGIFGCAIGVYAIGELYGSGGGSFKETLKWSPLTPIGATIGYQRSKRKQPPSVSLANDKFTLHLPTMSIQSSQLPYHRPQTDYMVRLVNVRF